MTTDTQGRRDYGFLIGLLTGSLVGAGLAMFGPTIEVGTPPATDRLCERGGQPRVRALSASQRARWGRGRRSHEEGAERS